MNARLNISVQRIAAIVFLLLFFISIWRIVIEPVHNSFRERNNTISQNIDTLTQLRQIAFQEPIFREQLSSLQADVITTAGQLTGTRTAVAAAELQERLQQILTENGGSVQSALTIEPSSDNGLTKIGVSIEGEISESGLASFLYSILNDSYSIYIDELQINCHDNSTITFDHLPLSFHIQVFNLFVKQQS